MFHVKKLTALMLAVVMIISLAMSCVTTTYAATAVSGLKTTGRTTKSITVSWTPVNGTVHYEVQAKSTSGHWVHMGYVYTGSSYTMSSLNPGLVHYVRIRRFDGKVWSSWSSTHSTCTLPNQVSGVMMSPLISKAVRWNIGSEHSSYQIQVMKDGATKNYYSSASTASTMTYPLDMNEKGTYTIKVRAYVLCPSGSSSYKVYGSWSNSIKYTV